MKTFNILLFSLFIYCNSNAQSASSAKGVDYFVGKWYLIAKGLPQGDVKIILTIENNDGKLSGKITNPIKSSQLFDLKDIAVNDSTFSAKFNAFETVLPIIMQKKNGVDVSGKLMGRFVFEGSKKELFDLDAPKVQTKSVPQIAKDTVFSKINVDFKLPKKELVRTEKYNNIALETLTDADINFYNNNGLHEKILRVWMVDEDFYDFEKGIYKLNTQDEYLTQASKVTDNLIINFGGKGAIIHFANTPEKILPVYTKILSYLKQKFPKIRFVEVMNEPDYGGDYVKHVKKNTYYQFYKYAAKAVVEINKKYKPTIPLEVGGPSIAQLDTNWLGGFLDDFKNDKDPLKKLDFISFHGYFLKPGEDYMMFKDNPSLVKDQRKLLDIELTKRGLSTKIPAFITETGIYPGPSFDDINSTTNDHLRQASGVASLFYWYLESDNIYPFHWVMRHLKEGRKDQLVTRDEFEKPFRQENKFTPYGNMMVMSSKLKKYRNTATSTSTFKDGKGLYSIASSDKTGIAVMTWNYQSMLNSGYKTELKLDNLPKEFVGKEVKLSIYKIDSKNSNYHADLENCNLKVFEEKTFKAEKSFQTNLFLDPNALQLIVLEVKK
jgi:hypothetical protein